VNHHVPKGIDSPCQSHIMILYVCAVVDSMTDMTPKPEHTMGDFSPTELKTLLAHKWPEASYSEATWIHHSFTTGHPEFDRLFPETGIPYGQLIEITGDISSGKTSLLFLMLSGITRKGVVAYLDFSGSFFPSAAIAGGVDIGRVIAVRPNELNAGHVSTSSLTFGLRAAELIFRHHLACCVVFDLVGEQRQLPLTLLHRLRIHTVRAKALVIFLTEQNSGLIPASTTSLKLHVERSRTDDLIVSVVRSRISREGIHVEVKLHE
jgi:hypothetical protein